ncbi:MAG: lysophospholipid acyltransferase family protein [Bilophila sp.]
MTKKDALFAQDTYTSPVFSPSWLARACPSLLFYLPLLWIVYQASRKATRQMYDGAAWIASSETTVQWLEKVGCCVKASGMESFRTLQEPCVFVGNHMSTLETFVLPALIQPWKDVTFVVKRSLITYPFFGEVLRSREPVVVGRTNAREDLTAVLQGGTACLEAGRSVVVFPQSTRSTTFDPALFNTIGVKLAKRAGVPIVPLALKTDAWSNGHTLKDFGPIDTRRTIHFAFGAPLTVAGQGKEEHHVISQFITEHLAQWNAEQPHQ